MVVVDGFTRHRGGPIMVVVDGFTRHKRWTCLWLL